MKKALFVFGTRPEAIKMAPVVRAFRQRAADIQTVVCVTGQHRQMLDQVLELFDIRPDIDLDIMKPGQDLFDITTAILSGLKKVLREEQPDLVLVHGDTTTSMAAALSAYYLQIPVAHVEAGLRTHKIYSPFPEEINRQMTGRIAAIDFCPTPASRENLLREGVPAENTHVTGNSVIDALLYITEKIKSDSTALDAIREKLETAGIAPLMDSSRRMILITGHRRENFGEGFLQICRAIRTLAERYPETEFIYPVHLNPNVQKPVFELLDGIPNVRLIQPQEYLPFVWLMQRSYLVLTDSGGIQEEAPALGKPVLVMRDTTERPEAVRAGTALLTGTDAERIVAECSRLMDDPDAYRAMAEAVNPYGDGQAAERMAEIVTEYFRR